MNILTSITRFLKNKNTVTILGVIAVIAILYIGYNQQLKSQTNPISVPVAKTTIQPGTMITSDMITYVSIPKNTRGIDRFLNDFPKSYQYFIDVFNTSADDLIEYIESNYPIKVDNEIKEKYKKMVSKNQKILKMIK